MKISAINSTQNIGNNVETTKEGFKKAFDLENFQTKIKNSADMNDTLVVPRTIFKGYMAFTVSTALGALSGFTKKVPKISGMFSIAASLTALWGTYAFVRPYLFFPLMDKQTDKKEDLQKELNKELSAKT